MAYDSNVKHKYSYMYIIQKSQKVLKARKCPYHKFLHNCWQLLPSKKKKNEVIGNCEWTMHTGLNPTNYF